VQVTGGFTGNDVILHGIKITGNVQQAISKGNVIM
jgi:hypothetical protein